MGRIGIEKSMELELQGEKGLFQDVCGQHGASP
ncbi:MAG: hypothetical protein ACLTBV_21050 [Enterocloster bolteae]